MEAALADYFDRLDRGERVDVSELAAIYPGCESELRRFQNHERKLRGAMAVVAPSPEDGGVGTAPRDNLAGRTLGDFRLRRVIGRGGMGIVWEAEQLSLGRTVALKLLPSGLCDDPRHRFRFHNEARILAQLEHPHIVGVIAVGEESDAYFFAMQYIDGITVDDLIRIWGIEAANSDAETRLGAALVDTDADDQPPPVNTPLTGESLPWISLPVERHERYNTSARIAAEVADGLAHAHECGVLHRDVKPSNVLLDKAGTARLSDFGLARMCGNATLTATGTMLGTLRYASPEQLRGTPTALDERSDVYSLGVMLWEMVADKRLFAAEDRNSIISHVLNVEAPRPSSLEAKVPRDLETIIARALAKEPADRYASARDFGDDLRRFLDGRPINARPISLAERTFRWANRNRYLTASALGSLIVLAVISMLASVLVWRANSQTTAALNESQINEDHARHSAADAEASARETLDLLYAADMSLAGAAWQKHEPAQVRMLLDRYRTPTARDDGSSAADPRGFEWHFLDRQIQPQSELLFQNDEALYVVQFVEGGEQLLTAGKDAIVRWHDSATGKVVRSLNTQQQEVNCVSNNPSGTLIATASDDGTVKIWNATDLSLLHSIKACDGLCCWAKFLDDEKILTGGFGEVHRLYNAASGQLLREYTTRDAKVAAKSSPSSWNAHLSRTGDRFWTTQNSEDRRYRGVYEWNVETGESRGVSKDSELCNVISDNSEKFLFVNTKGGQVRILDMKSGDEVQSFNLDNLLEALAVSPDDRHLVVGDHAGQVYVWNLDLADHAKIVASETPETFSIHDGPVYAVAFPSDNESLYTVGRDGSVQRTIFRSRKVPFRELPAIFNGLCIPVPGTDLVIASANTPLALRDRVTGTRVREYTSNHYQAAAVSSDGTLLAAATKDHLRIWKLANGELVRSINHTRRWAKSLAFSADNSHISVDSRDIANDRTDVVEIATGTIERLSAPGSESRWACSCIDDGVIARKSNPGHTIVCWNARDKTVRWETKSFGGSYTVRAVSPDRTLLLTGGRTRALTLFDCATGEVRYEVPCEYPIKSLAFIGDGRSFVVGGEQGQLTVWHADSGQHLFEIANVGRAIESIHSLGDGFMASTRQVKDGRTEIVWLEF